MVNLDSADQGGAMVLNSENEKRSIWSIMVGVFTSPAEAFAAYDKKPRIWAVLIVTILLSLVFNMFLAEYQAKMQYELMSQSQALPPQVLDQMRESVENPDQITGAIMGGVMVVVIGLITALLAWGIGSFVMGGDSKFKKVWGVSLLGGLIYLVGNLVKLPLMMAKGNMYVSFGLAALLPDKDFTSIMYWLFYYLDAFMIWDIIVTGIGFAVVFNISRGKGIAVAAISSVIMMVVMMGLALMGMSLAGVEITFF